MVTLKNEETALLGDAILAGVAAGIYPSIAEGCQAMVVRKETIYPNQDAAFYQGLYPHYCELDQEMSNYFRHMYEKK